MHMGDEPHHPTQIIITQIRLYSGVVGLSSISHIDDQRVGLRHQINGLRGRDRRATDVCRNADTPSGWIN
jgi:hypothetical protein